MIAIKKINYVDWYKINLKILKIRNWKSQFKVEMSPKRNYGLQILGCYDQSSLQEKHEFGLVFALSKLEAKI